MSISIPEKCLKDLDTFFANKTIHDVNRDSYLICNLHDNVNRITVSLVFLRDWDSLESDSFNQVIIESKGVVFQFPCYWISIPKELTMGYLTYIINTFYNEYVSKWIANSGSTGNSGTSNIHGSSTNNTNCGCNTGFINPYHQSNFI